MKMNSERTKENTNNKNANREKRNRLIATHEGERNKKHGVNKVLKDRAPTWRFQSKPPTFTPDESRK